MSDKYLGDGVYLHRDDNTAEIELYTFDGTEKTNQIFLNADVLVALSIVIGQLAEEPR